VQANNGGEVTHFVIHADTIYRKHCTRGGSFDFFFGGGGRPLGVLEDFKKKFPATQGERKKKSCSIQSRKKYHAKESAQKKFLHVNLLKLFTSVSTGLQDFAFLSS
jgi:hypothetical protein